MSNENESLHEMLSAFITQQTEFNEYQRGINAATQARLNGIQDDLTQFNDDVDAKFAEADARFEGLANDAAEVKRPCVHHDHPATRDSRGKARILSRQGIDCR